MTQLNNIFLYEHSPEAIRAIEAGEARISSGGVIRVGSSGKGFKELARPASMSVADLLSLFEDKEHALATENEILQLNERLNLSENGIKQLQEIEWLNNAEIQRTYNLTNEGFRKMLVGLDCVVQETRMLEHYIRQHDIEDLIEKAQIYLNYMKTDEANLRSNKFDVTNSHISEHLDQISAFLKRLLGDVAKEGDSSFIAVQIIVNLLQPFSFLVRRFSALYYYENGFLPGDYDEWVNTIDSAARSQLFHDKLQYFINLKTTIPFRDKMMLSNAIVKNDKHLLSGIEFDNRYITSHTKEEYLALPDKIREKIDDKQYLLENGNLGIIL